VEAVDEDGMPSPEDGGGARGGPSELAAVAGLEASNARANSERRPNALKRIGRYASFAALVGIVVALGVHTGLQVVMLCMGPPPLQP